MLTVSLTQGGRGIRAKGKCNCKRWLRRCREEAEEGIKRAQRKLPPLPDPRALISQKWLASTTPLKTITREAVH